MWRCSAFHSSLKTKVLGSWSEREVANLKHLLFMLGPSADFCERLCLRLYRRGPGLRYVWLQAFRKICYLVRLVRSIQLQANDHSCVHLHIQVSQTTITIPSTESSWIFLWTRRHVHPTRVSGPRFTRIDVQLDDRSKQAQVDREPFSVNHSRPGSFGSTAIVMQRRCSNALTLSISLRVLPGGYDLRIGRHRAH